MWQINLAENAWALLGNIVALRALWLKKCEGSFHKWRIVEFC